MSRPPRRSRTASVTAAHPSTVDTSAVTKCSALERLSGRERAVVCLLGRLVGLAFMNDLDIVAVWIEHPCRIIARIVFEPSLRGLLALTSGVHSRFVKRIYLSMVFRYESNMHGLGIGLSFSEPEKGSFAVTKTLQIGVSVLAFVVYKVCDPKRLQ